MMEMNKDGDLVEFRLVLLENNQRELSTAVLELTKAIVVIRTWGAAAILIHPIIVGMILKWAVT